jgi:hypothetical protein
MGHARSGAPAESAIELAMDMVAVGDGWGVHLVLCKDLEVDVMIGPECLQDGIETLPRPLEQLAEPMDKDAVMVRAEALVGGLELPSQGVGLSEPRPLLLVVEPCA